MKQDDEACDIGNAEIASVTYTDSGFEEIPNAHYSADTLMAGCTACMTVEPDYICWDPGVGECSATCGNGTFDGRYPAVGRDQPLALPEEECDDGNNVDGDGCSRMCRLENSNPDGEEFGVLDGDLWLCEHLFYDLLYEFPRF